MKTKSPAVGGRYFAYSLSLDPAFRQAAKVDLKAGQPAELPAHELVFRASSSSWKGRIAGFERGSGSVQGLLFEVPADAWPQVEAMERGLGAQPVKVMVMSAGKSVEATAFVPAAAPNDFQQPVSESFMARLLTAVNAAQVPEPYRTQLQAEALILEKVQRFGREHAIGATR